MSEGISEVVAIAISKERNAREVRVSAARAALSAPWMAVDSRRYIKRSFPRRPIYNIARGVYESKATSETRSLNRSPPL